MLRVELGKRAQNLTSDTARRELAELKDDMQRFFTKLMQKSFLAAYCNTNPSV